jgi:putative hydrolase of the HAD superfamily
MHAPKVQALHRKRAHRGWSLGSHAEIASPPVYSQFCAAVPCFSKTSAEVCCETPVQRDLGPNSRPDRPNNEEATLKTKLGQFKYLTFDVVGTLIDFEGGLTASLAEIAAEADRSVDGEQALSLYRAARYSADADLFPDDLVRVYAEIAPQLGLPVGIAFGERFRDSAKTWKAFPDSTAALARLAKRYRLIAMTNARRWALDHFERKLGMPFFATFTVDDTGTEKPDPAFFQQVIDFVAHDGGSKASILHVAQSQYHDIGVSRQLGLTNCWIERRHAQPGYGGTVEPSEFTEPDFHFHSLAELADAVDLEIESNVA